MTIYLASKSPRRRELLAQMAVPFELLSVDIPEIVRPNEQPDDYSKRITEEKCLAAWQKVSDKNLSRYPVLCADTEVILDNEILGKPENERDAFNMLKRYSGQHHRVITSVGLIFTDYLSVRVSNTIVHFANMTDKDIQAYLKTGDYKGKSGSYGIQSYLGQFITHIEGCFYSVMGLPLNTVREMLSELRVQKTALD